MFDPCVIPKHQKQKTPAAETGETAHFHVNSNEELNMFYYDVNHRVQSNRQFT